MQRTFTAQTDLQALLLQQALAMATELEALADDASDGQVLAVAELAAVQKGRDLTRQALQGVLQRQAQAVEKKGRLPELAPAVGRGSSKIKRPKLW